jgi:1-acyl-sn-glycerol-3-phosphate acyltransferase
MARYSLIYEFIDSTVNQPLRFGFYRKIEVQNYDKVPRNKPVILAGNHQNALLDALNVVGARNRHRQITFLTRSDVFNHPLKDFMINRLKMLPIYRQRDGVDVIKKNEEIFQICVDRLSNNEVVLIFPEGNHARVRRVRPLKKGIARIAFQAAEQNDFDLDLYIVPVGIHYENALKFHNDLLVNFGDPIPLTEYYDTYQSNPRRALVNVVQEVRKGMSEVVIHIMDKEHYDLIDGLWQMYAPQLAKERGHPSRKLYPQLLAGREIVAALEAHLKEDDSEALEMEDKMIQYQEGLEELRLRDHVLRKGPYSLPKLIVLALGLILGFPAYLFGVVNNYLPYRMSYWPGRFFIDDHFHSSIRSLAGYIIFPLYYLLLTLLVWGISGSGWTALAYLVALPITGSFAINYSEWVKKWWSRLRFRGMKARKDEKVLELEKLRSELIDWCRSILKKQAVKTDTSPSSLLP